MNVLEERYRRVLSILPAQYRAEREEELVATFLESSWTGDGEYDGWLRDYGRPDLHEVVSVLALAARVRLAGPAGDPGAYAWGQAVRVLALVCLLANALVLPMALAQHLWIAGHFPLPTATVDAIDETAPLPAWWSAVEWLALVAWFGAFLALVLGRRRAAVCLALAAVTPSVASAVLAAADVLLGRTTRSGSPATLLTLLTINVAVVLALAAFHDGAPPVDRQRWLVRLAIASALVPVPGVLLLLQPGHSVALTVPDVFALAWLVAAAWSSRFGSQYERLAVALAAALVGAVTGAALVDGAGGGLSRGAIVVAAIETTVVAGLGLWLARRALREMPRSFPFGAPLAR